MCHREARLRQNQEGSLFQALGRHRSNPLSYRASSPEVFLIVERSKSFGPRLPSVLDVARSFRIARNRLWPRWQRERSQGVCLSWVDLLWVTSHRSVSSEPLQRPAMSLLIGRQSSEAASDDATRTPSNPSSSNNRSTIALGASMSPAEQVRAGEPPSLGLIDSRQT